MLCAPISAGDVAVTVTPGITAPWASATVPINRPWVICANAVVPNSTPTTAMIINRSNLRFIPRSSGKTLRRTDRNKVSELFRKY